MGWRTDGAQIDLSSASIAPSVIPLASSSATSAFRGWSEACGIVGGPIAREDGAYGTTKQVLPRATWRAVRIGAGAHTGLPVAVGGHSIRRGETRLLGQGAPAPG